MSALTHLPTPVNPAHPAGPATPPRPVLVRPSISTGDIEDLEARFEPRPIPAPSPVPEVPNELESIARKVARGALEVLGGTRPLQQMSRLLDARSYERLQLRSNLVRSIELSQNALPTGTATQGGAARLHRNVMIRSVRICPITPAVFEASVVAAEQKRVRALALRIERWRGQWRVTELQIG